MAAVRPALTLALTEAAVFMRLLRSDLISTLQDDFILSAKAKGMPVWRILLHDALRLGFRNGTGPFRSFGHLGCEPRPYQLVPLMMALRLDPVRLLIADDVGVGKTIEAGLVIHEARAIPEAGQTFTFHGYRFQVMRKSRNRIASLRVTPLGRKDAASGPVA